MRNDESLLATLLLSSLVLNDAYSSPLQMKMFGHSVEVKNGKDGQDELFVDRKSLLKDQYISLDEVATVDGTLTVIGQRSAGGNACEGSAFILSFPPSAKPRIDGPLDACNPNKVMVEDRQVTVRVEPTPRTEGSLWTWTPGGGFSAEKPIPFATRKDDGWGALRSRTIDHPSSILDYADLSRLLDVRIGSSKEAFVSVSSGPGSVQYRNNLLIGSACRAHSCDDTDLLIVIDIAGRQAFAAIKDGAGPARFFPKADEWPMSAKPDLTAFQRKWKR